MQPGTHRMALGLTFGFLSSVFFAPPSFLFFPSNLVPLFISFRLASLEQEFNNGCINKSRGGGSIEKKRRPWRKRRESSGFQPHRNPGSVLMDWALAGCRSRSQGWETEEAVQDQPPGGWRYSAAALALGFFSCQNGAFSPDSGVPGLL